MGRLGRLSAPVVWRNRGVPAQFSQWVRCCRYMYTKWVGKHIRRYSCDIRIAWTDYRSIIMDQFYICDVELQMYSRRIWSRERVRPVISPCF